MGSALEEGEVEEEEEEKEGEVQVHAPPPGTARGPIQYALSMASASVRPTGESRR